MRALYIALKLGLLLCVLLALFVAVSGREKALQTLFGPVASMTIHFPTLTLGSNPNQFLVCPLDYCAAPPHLVSKNYPVSVTVLKQRWMTMIQAQPRIQPGAADEENRQYAYIQRSALMRFPDSITVHFIVVSDTESTLAVYSQSHYGKSDFGANESRIRNWLSLIEQP